MNRSVKERWNWIHLQFGDSILTRIPANPRAYRSSCCRTLVIRTMFLLDRSNEKNKKKKIGILRNETTHKKGSLFWSRYKTPHSLPVDWSNVDTVECYLTSKMKRKMLFLFRLVEQLINGLYYFLPFFHLINNSR